MKADLITIGDEILIGQIVDTNSAWLAKSLHDIGIRVNQIKSISDEASDIIDALDSSKAEIIIITGGLGPTNDDITKQTLSRYFDSELVFNEAVFKHIGQLLVGRGIELNALNRSQAMLPKDAKVLFNRTGTAAGMWFNSNDRQVISLPGVPFEMKGIVEEHVLPELLNQNGGHVVVSKTVLTTGLPESMLAVKIADWENNLPNHLKLAYLPKPGIVRLRLTAEGANRTEIEESIQKEVEKLQQILTKEIFGFDEETLEQVVGRLLLEKKCTLSTAESCTGGQIAALITSVAGSSAYFKGSVVAYHNQIKSDILHVNNSNITKYGAVSQQVVEEMAMGAIELLKTDYAISVSGIAGPSGGTQEKPVGTTWIAVSDGKNTISQQFTFGEHRGRNITRASLMALNMLRLLIINKI